MSHNKEWQEQTYEIANVSGPSSSPTLPPPSLALLPPSDPPSVAFLDTAVNPWMVLFQQLILAVEKGNTMKR